MQMRTDADMTAERLAKLGIVPTRRHLAALSDSSIADHIVKLSRKTDTPHFLSFRMGHNRGVDLRVYAVDRGDHWEVFIHSDTYCHVDDTTFPKSATVGDFVGWCEAREDW